MKAATPLVSVVIPTFERPELLTRCLDAVCAQDFYPDEFEIIVVDDGHEDAIRARVEARAREKAGAPALRCVRPARGRGPSVARNCGWRAARGALIAFTDDDTVPEAEWLANGVQTMQRHPGWSALCGRVQVPRLNPGRPTRRRDDRPPHRQPVPARRSGGPEANVLCRAGCPGISDSRSTRLMKMTTSPSSISKTSSSPGKSSNASTTRKPAKSSLSSPVSRSTACPAKRLSKSVSPASSLLSLSISAEHRCACCGSTSVQMKHVTRSFGKGTALLIIEGIPMWSCPSCGESYFSARTLHEIQRIEALRKSLGVDRPVPVVAFEAPTA